MKTLEGLTVRRLGTEALAGLTLLAIAVPLNIGYAQIAGLPPTAGLYAMIVPAILYAFFASTREMVASPDAAAAALVASSLGGLAVAGGQDYAAMAMAQAIIGGGILIVCAVFKLGFLANFLSEPILIGFVGGLALTVLVSQVAKMLGVPITAGASFPAQLAQLVTGLGAISLWSAAIAAGSIGILLGGRKLVARVPWALVVLIAATGFITVVGATDLGVKVLGPIQAGPPVIGWPQLDLSAWLQLTPSSAALVLVAMAEGLLVARRYAQKNGYVHNPNRDIFAIGAANVAAGVSGGFSIGASTSRTAAMDQAGSRSQFPTLVAAAGTLLLVLFGTALLTNIPSPAIGAIIAVAVAPLLGIREFASLWRQSKFEFAVGAACFVGVLVVGALYGLLIAFVLSLVNLARRAANPSIDILALSGDPMERALAGAPGAALTAPGVVVVRFSAPLFFGNATVFSRRLEEVAAAAVPLGAKHVVIDCEGITDVDVTGAKSFKDTIETLRKAGLTLHVSRVRSSLKKQLSHFGLLDGVAIFSTNLEAVQKLADKTGSPSEPAGE